MSESTEKTHPDLVPTTSENSQKELQGFGKMMKRVYDKMVSPVYENINAGKYTVDSDIYESEMEDIWSECARIVIDKVSDTERMRLIAKRQYKLMHDVHNIMFRMCSDRNIAPACPKDLMDEAEEAYDKLSDFLIDFHGELDDCR